LAAGDQRKRGADQQPDLQQGEQLDGEHRRAIGAVTGGVAGEFQ